MKTLGINLAILLITSYGFSQGLTSKVTPNGILISEDNHKILYYQRETKTKEGQYPRANYIHPLYDLQGNPITEDFPEDHKHHRGIFWAWHQVLVNGEPMGDSWECTDFNWEVVQATTEKVADQLLLKTKTLWNSPKYIKNGLQTAFVEENTQITINPSEQNYRIMDFRISLNALVDDVKIGGSDDIKGYGGFSARLVLPSDIQFTSEKQQLTPKNEAIKAHRAMRMDGTIDQNQKLGVMIIASKSNPKPNNAWILRSSNSMQNAVYPGRKPVPIIIGTPTVLKYRMVIYNVKPSQEQLKLWQRF